MDYKDKMIHWLLKFGDNTVSVNSEIPVRETKNEPTVHLLGYRSKFVVALYQLNSEGTPEKGVWYIINIRQNDQKSGDVLIPWKPLKQGESYMFTLFRQKPRYPLTVGRQPTAEEVIPLHSTFFKVV